MVLDAQNNVLYLTDAGAETVSRVDTNTGKSQVLIRFYPFARQTPQGVAYVDNVPTALCQLGDQLLVGFLTGAPFPAGESTLRSLDPRTLDDRQYIGGLQAVLDTVCIKGIAGADRVYVLESNPTAANVGRLRLYEGANGRVLAEGLPNSTGMARDPVSGDLFLANQAQGRILRVAAISTVRGSLSWRLEVSMCFIRVLWPRSTAFHLISRFVNSNVK